VGWGGVFKAEGGEVDGGAHLNRASRQRQNQKLKKWIGGGEGPKVEGEHFIYRRKTKKFNGGTGRGI